MFTNDLQHEKLNTIAAFSSLNKQQETLHIEYILFLLTFQMFSTICYLYILFYVSYRAAKVNTHLFFRLTKCLMLLHLFGNLFCIFWQYVLITGANSHNFARKPQKVSISNAEKLQTPHLSVYSSFLFLYLFIEDQHMTHSSFAYYSIYLMAHVLLNETRKGNVIILSCKIPQRHGMKHKRNKSTTPA